MAKNKANEKTYILELQNGNIRKVSVPPTWKLTFGPTIPYSGKYTGTSNGTALRFYEGNKDNLRAVFTDVKAFRDESIDVMERRTEIQRKVVQQNNEGGVHNVEIAAHITQWVNPDDDSVENQTKPASAPFVALLQGM